MIYVNEKYLNYTATLCGEVKESSYAMAGLNTDDGAHLDVLDVGCGTGIDTAKMARYLAPDSRVVGVDSDPEMVRRADEKALQQGLHNVTHICSKATDLIFENEFDVVRAERLFQHLTDPETVFARMVRAARPGGKVLIVDTDWSTLQCTLLGDPENRAIADEYSNNLTFGSNLRVFHEFFANHNFKIVEDRVIGVKLDFNDYMTASKIKDLLPMVYDEVKCKQIFNRLEAGAKLDQFGVIDIVLIAGIKP